MFISEKNLRTRRASFAPSFCTFWCFNAGVGGLIGFLGHTFIADEVAESIGWPKENPFQFEVGVANLSYGVLGLLCIWIRGTFWIAVGLGFSVFLLGAAYGHIADIVVHENYAPNNAGAMLYADILIPLMILGLLIVDRRGQSQAS